nr:unnamed protein product [Callosobruchus analis]
MRIFLVVSPPAGKLQVRSRSLNHLDHLEMRQGVIPIADPALKDSRSEPDCTRSLTAPPVASTAGAPGSAARGATVTTRGTSRRHVLSRPQVGLSLSVRQLFPI